ncbi:MAG: antitoxin [Alphaproteobacteria bacterium]|nr:MAG: antitoxin [Alphaproteobacteria bacterium]
MTHIFSAEIKADGKQFLITFPDVPEAITGADTMEETKQEALDALVTALGEYARSGKAMPKASPTKQGQVGIRIPALMIAKLDLMAAMKKQDISGAQLARRLKTTDTTVRRILDFNHRSHIDQVEDALSAIGHVLEISTRAA